MDRSSHALEVWIHRYERYVAPFTFVIGFLFDTITLKRVDFWIDHLVLIAYMIIAGGAIIILYSFESGRLRFWIVERGIALVPMAMQFAFGGLFSAFVIFYIKSASVAKSWLFLSMLAVIFVGNERFQKRYHRLTFQISIFFIAVFSYSIFLVPILIRKIGADIFLLSGVVSIASIALFLFILSGINRRRIRESMPAFAISIGVLYAAFNLLYFTNVIPPIPLSLKESGIYHSVSRTNENAYAVTFEKAPWYLPLEHTSRMYHWKEGEPIYYFTAVFAPSLLTVTLFHRWSWYDTARREWKTPEEIALPIFGGRDRGYRGYSFKTGITPGIWRVEVVTERGQVLGRETFTVVEVSQEPALEYGLR